MTTERRAFLIGTAAAAANLATAQTQEIRTAHIGVGSRGGNLLDQTLLEENVKVSVICDIDPQTRDQRLTRAQKHNPRGMSEWRAVLDLKDIDAVFIATPCNMHAQMAAAALEAGKYVYCEKPLATQAEDVALVLKASQKAKGFLQIGQQLRYFPTMQEAIKQVHDGIIGKSYVIKAHRHGSQSKPAENRPEPTAQQAKRTAWYADVKQSGDLIVENAIHNIDACNWIANSRPVSAYGHGKKYFPTPMPPGSVMMDGFSVEYIYENDMHLDYSQLTFHPRNMKTVPSGQWYGIFGEKGSIYLTHDSATFYDLYGNEERDILSTSKQATEAMRARGFREGDMAVDEFFKAIREKRQPFADIKVAATAALTVIMGREAIYKGRSVTWKELGVTV
jgi:predicted dehydrogenase